nr:TPA_asm: m79.5 sORF [Murid betaherpesvirus 1]DBA07834.1 TPA_asm: m79.5 sORF [Murid betaherpesvirus 1]
MLPSDSSSSGRLRARPVSVRIRCDTRARHAREPVISTDSAAAERSLKARCSVSVGT